MQSEIFSGNSSINSRIHECFQYLQQDDVAKFKKRFREHNADQKPHTFRELLVGGFLAKTGLQPRYEREIEGKTPDWALLQGTDEIAGVLDVLTFHKDWATERSMSQSLSRGEVWCGWMPSNSERLFQKLQEKVGQYRVLVAKLKVPYVIALFGEFLASIDDHEINDVLFTDHGGGIFGQSPSLSGFLFFEESGGRYRFSYFPNPSGQISIAIPSGVF
jgi:hypothetical protein